MVRRKRDRASFDDGTQVVAEPPRGDYVAREARSNGDNASAGSAPSYVHTVRPVGSLVGDRFVVKAHVGRGRSGERYEAVDRSLSDPDLASERYVVLHFLNGRVAGQTRVLQKLEASYHHPHLWAHRNLFSVLAFGSDHGEYFFVTEQLEGGTLRTILDEVAPELPTEEESLGVLAGVGDALKYAHAKGVVHGDIRPENIFVTKDLVVKVLDLLPATLPRTVPLFPEDNAAHAPAVPDPRDDVYGLACVAYELFAGKHPFNSNTALEALAAGLKPVPIPQLDARSWDALVRGLALRRDQRPPSVAAFLADFGVSGRERLRRDGEGDRAPPARSVAPLRTVPDEDTEWDLGDKTVAAPRVSPRGMTAPSMSAPYVDYSHDLFRIRRDDDRPGRARGWAPWLAALVLGIGAAVYWEYASLQERVPALLALGRELADRAVAHDKGTGSASVDGEPAAAPPDVAPPPAGRQPASSAPAAGSAPRQANGASNGGALTSKELIPPKDATAPPKGANALARDANAPPKETAQSPIDANAPPKDAAQPPRDAVSKAKDIAPPNDGGTQPAPAPSSQTTQVKQAPVAGQPVAVETFEPEKPMVVVSEAAPSVAVTIRRHGSLDAPTSFVWWTSDGTAVADEDYVNFGARIEKLAAGEQARTVYIPIVHDSKREGRESFYVNVRPGQGKREDPAQRVEVVIEDDD